MGDTGGDQPRPYRRTYGCLKDSALTIFMPLTSAPPAVGARLHRARFIPGVGSMAFHQMKPVRLIGTRLLS